MGIAFSQCWSRKFRSAGSPDFESGAGRPFHPFAKPSLGPPFHTYDHVCGEGFSAQTRRERRAYPFPTRRDKARATTSGPKRTAARRVASLFGSGVVAPRSSRQVGTGDAPSSRLARTEKRRNKRGRIYEMEYLVGSQLCRA